MQILQKVADHCAAWAQLDLPVPSCVIRRQEGLQYRKVDGASLHNQFLHTDWSQLENGENDEGAKFLNDEILEAAREHIPSRVMMEKKSSHPWMNERVLDFVRAKLPSKTRRAL